MVNRCRWATIALVSASLMGCQQTFRLSEKTLALSRVNQKIAVMPPDVELSELTMGGVKVPNAVWSEQAKTYLLDGIRKSPAFKNLDFVEIQPPPQNTPEDRFILSVQKLHTAVGDEIMLHSYNPAYTLPTKGAKLDWSMGPLAKELRHRTNAKHALFIHVNDTYSSSGRVAYAIAVAIFAGVAIPGGQQQGFASLVDLETGDVVWFNNIARNAGDLRSPGSVQETVDALFAGFPLERDCKSC
ncbi:MAG: hypothetical protein HQL45_10055 [Alphaproteobacteria bacterium]|nr:hypothetical protein [Alphaproteobacteria bacterium]